MDIISKIKKVDWQNLVCRKVEALLHRSITDFGYKYFKKATGIDWKATKVMRLYEGHVLHDRAELEQLKSIIIAGSSEFLKDFAQKTEDKVKELDKFAREISQTDCAKLSDKDLVDLTKKYFDLAMFTHNFLLPMPVADKALTKMISDRLPEASDEQKQAWLAILIFSEKENYHTTEERAFYKLAENYLNKSKELDQEIKKHLEKFEWIGARGYNFQNTWDKEQILDRLDNFEKQNRDPKEESEYLEQIKKDRQKDFEKMIAKLKIKKDSELYRLIIMAKKYAYLRTWRTDLIYRAGYYVQNLLQEIAKRANFDFNEIIHLTFQEAIQMAEDKKSPVEQDEIDKRKEYFVLVTFDSEQTVLAGKEYREKLKEVIDPFVAAEKQKEIKGAIAYKGIVQGTVKVVHDPSDLPKVKRGDILVAVMTFPHFIQAMEKAAAFVTDEGGILCHAAIVSREMRKPCIIATKNATRILKDGDEVEIDAEKGIVKIL